MAALSKHKKKEAETKPPLLNQKPKFMKTL
jgi:hypothetical protein